jgi:hypothetical protein
MSDKTQMLKEVVERMLEGGALDGHQEIINVSTYYGGKEINPSKMLKQYRIGLVGLSRSLKDKDTKCHYNVSLPDLLADLTAMEALFGLGDEICLTQGCPYFDKGATEDNCTGEKGGETALATCNTAIRSTHAKHHSRQAFHLIQDGKQDEAVKYLWTNMVREEG